LTKDSSTGWCTAGTRTVPGTLRSRSVQGRGFQTNPPDIHRLVTGKIPTLPALRPRDGALTWVQDPADHPRHDDNEQGQHLQVAGQDGAGLGVTEALGRERPLDDDLWESWAGQLSRHQHLFHISLLLARLTPKNPQMLQPLGIRPKRSVDVYPTHRSGFSPDQQQAGVMP